MKVVLLAAVLAVVLPAAARAQESPSDWSAVGTEAMGYFKDLIRIDTSNPPGNETQAANYIRDVLARNGIESELFALDPARANLVARIRGNGSRRPILVMGHTDVVGTQPENWSVDPFAARSTTRTT
jgi:acetylornithine deacetylase/succinyl-diaminopimelate desuccinylase-like protein